ncbi:MAG: RNA pseudouridine synthase [Nitrospinae bacterium CG11_big_fil_rev_8_21_14_0_20_56_8]|nr:MAG: RNA pseudouridine synthase [Nitrospinae bacterium CG11_big_fil_rev_8_21_14_0_20_56_8]
MVKLHTLPPSEQIYQSCVPPKYHGLPIETYFATRFYYLSEEEWTHRIRAGDITLNGRTAQPGEPVSAQDRTVARMGLRAEPPANRDLQVLYEDRHLRVFNKQAPIPVHPSGRYFKNSMTELLKEAYPDEVPRPVQRLDAITTGVLVFARTREAAAYLMEEFQSHRVHKEYLALVEGEPRDRRFVIDQPIGKVQGSRRVVDATLPTAQSARTEVEWVASFGGRSLLRVIPRSGRTNQIRVHLAHVGLPLVNDPVYGSPGESENEFGLHAHRLEFACFARRFDLTAACPGHFRPFLPVEA